MANGAFKFKDNSGNVVSFISGSGSDILFSGGTLDLSGMTGLTLGNLTLSGTTQNAISASHAASYLLTSSFNTYTGTTNTLIGTLQTSTSSLNSFTSSATSRLSSIETSTGSLNTFTSSATTRLNSIESVSGSYATTGSNQFKNAQAITGSLTVTGYIEAQELRTTYISSSILYRSGSTKFGDELNDTHAFTGSLLVSGTISVPSSNLVSSSVQVDVMSTTNIARLATTGSNTFTGALSGTSATFTSFTQASNFITDGSQFFGFTLKGRASDNFGAIGFYNNNGATRVGYIQSGTINGGQVNITGDGGGSITLDDRGITATGTATFSNLVSLGGGSEGLRLGNVGDNSAYDNVKLYYTGFSGGSPRIYLTPRTTPGSGVINTFLHLQNTNGTSTSSNNTMGLFVDGQMGIGTTSPGTKLEILSRAADADRTIPHNVLTITATQGNAPYGFFGGAILFKNSSYVTGVVESSRIRSVIYDDGAPNNFGGGLWFETTATPGGTLTPSLVLNYQGRVGIGLNNPSYRLHVVGATDIINATSTTTDARINIGHSGNGGYVGYSNIGAGDAANTFYVTNGSGIIGSGIIMNNAGTVGIGLTNPTSSTKLMVAGGIGFGNNTDGQGNLSYGGRISAKQTNVTGGAGATLIHRGLGSVGYFILVSGIHSSNRFMDLIYGTGGNTPIVLASNTENTFPTRTYSISGENIFLSLTGVTAVWIITTTGLGAMES